MVDITRIELMLLNRSLALKGRGIELSRSFAEVNAKAIMLQKLLDDASGKHKDMEKKYFDILEQNMVLQSALKSGPEGQNLEGSEPLHSLIKPLTHRCNSTKSIRDTIQREKNAVELRSELALIQGALQAALRQSEGECMTCNSPQISCDADIKEAAVISNSPLDVVDILSKFNYKEVEKLRKENAELRAQVQTGRTKDDHSSDGSISNKDLKAFLDQIEVAAGGPDSKNASISVVEFSGNLQKLITEVRERTAKRQQVQQQSILSSMVKRVESVLLPKSSAATPATTRKWNWSRRQKLTQPNNSTSSTKTPK